MTVTFPRAWPASLPISGLSFELEPMEELTPLRSGETISADLGPALWRAKYQSPRLSEDQISEVKAWYRSIRSAEAFYGFDHYRQYPRAYRSGWPDFGSPFNGTCLMTNVTSSKLVALTDLPVGFVFSNNDYISFDYGTDSRALHSVVEGGVADGSGDVVVEVRPSVRVGWSVSPSPTVHLYRASAKFIILPKTFQAPQEPGGFGTVSFEAIQTL